MQTVSQKLKNAISRKGFTTVKECAQTLGLPYELLRKVVGEDHIPKDEQLLVYAKKLSIDPKELLFTAYHQKAPSEFKEYFGRKVVNEAPFAYSKIPILDWVQAIDFVVGSNKFFYRNDLEYMTTNLSGEWLFALKVKGNSMEPLFFEDETLIIDSQAKARPGDYVIINSNQNKAMFRLLKEYRGFLVLHPLNLKYEDQEMARDMRVVGKVVRKQLDF